MEKVAAALVFLLYLSSAQQEHCGSIGNDNETAATLSRSQFFYLNTANPANCTGNVKGWRVCYYGPEIIDRAGSYWATYAVYRRVRSQTEDKSITLYTRVSEIFSAIRTVSRFTDEPIADGEIEQGGFNCYTDSIDADDSPLTIQAGDILGACIFNPEDMQSPPVVNRFPLHVVGETSTGETLLQMDTAGCTREAIPSDIDISSKQLSILNSKRLHIYANIDTSGTKDSQTTTRNPSTSTVLPSHITNSPTMTTEKITGSQRARIAIAVGSIGGGLLLLVTITVTIICLILKKYNLSANQRFEKSCNDETTTENSVACKPVLHAVSGITDQQRSANNLIDSKLDIEQNVVRAGSSTDHGDIQISLKSNVAYYKSRKPLDMNTEHNVTCGSSTDMEISLTSNVAYSKSPGRQLEDSCDYENDRYDYI